MSALTGIQKTLIAVLTVVLLGGAYFFYQTGAATFLGITLHTNPDLERGLVGHWTFDGENMDWSSTTAQIRDRSGNNNHGSTTATTSTSTAPTAGVLGQGMQFDGVDDYVGGRDSSSLDITDDITVAGWIKLDTQPPDPGGTRNPRLFQKGPNVGTQVSYILKIDSTGGTITHPKFDIYVSNTKYDVESLENISLREWHHVTGIRRGTTLEIYVDGILASSTTAVSGAMDNEGDFYMGRSPGNSDGIIDGSLDDIRVYNRALSADEVKRLYGLGATTKIAETVTTNPNLERGLVGHWTFDGENVDWSSTTAEIRDRSLQGNHGNATTTMLATSSVTSGVLGQAMNFDGFGDMIDVGEPSSLQLTGAMTAAAWVYIDEYDVMPHVNSRFIAKNAGSINRGWDLNLENTGVASFQISSDGTAEFKATSTTAFATGVWIHYVGVYIPSTAVQLYANGVLVAQNTTAIPASQYDTTRNIFIGDRESCANCLFDGKLDDIRVYNRALSADEIKRLYQLGATTKIAETITTNPNLESGLILHWTFDGENVDWSSTTAEVRDRSPSAYQGNAINMDRTYVSPGPIGQGMRFATDTECIAGTNSSVLRTTAPLTSSVWIKADVDGQDGNVIVNQRNSGAPFRVWRHHWTRSTGWKWSVTNAAGTAITADSNTNITTGVWHHMVGVLKSNYDMELWIDGVLQTDQPNSASIYTGTNAAFWAGCEDGTSFTFGGVIDDVRVYNRALSADEIQRLYGLGH